MDGLQPRLVKHTEPHLLPMIQELVFGWNREDKYTTNWRDLKRRIAVFAKMMAPFYTAP